MKHRNKKPKISNAKAWMIQTGYRRKLRQLAVLEEELKHNRKVRKGIWISRK